jgi:hypothetical protein
MTDEIAIEPQQQEAVEFDDGIFDEALDRMPLVQVTEYNRRGP